MFTLNNIQNIFDWYNNFNNKTINIIGLEKDFTIDIDNKNLAHLLGLQYINSTGSIKGRRLYNFIKNSNLSDEQIYQRIASTNPNKLSSVRDRVDNIVGFLKNLHNAKIYEMTNVNSRIKSKFLGVDINDANIRMLGIASTDYEDYLETFLVRTDNLYFRNSQIEDPVISITEILLDGKEKLFSFDKDRQLRLDRMNPSLSLSEHRDLIKATNINKRENSFEYDGFKYYPVRPWSSEEKEMSLSEISKYLFTDGLFDNEYKNNRIDEFYAQVPDAYKDCDLFYNDATQNLYFISEKGLQGYSKYQGADLTKELKRCFDIQDKNIGKDKPSLLKQMEEYKKDVNVAKNIKKHNNDLEL